MSFELSNVGKCISIAQVITDVNTPVICERLGVARQQVHRWKKQRNIKIHTVQQLASIFDMTVDEFINLDRK